jgi:hypothetical protein
MPSFTLPSASPNATSPWRAGAQVRKATPLFWTNLLQIDFFSSQPVPSLCARFRVFVCSV